MKHITIDRIITILLTAVIVLIHQHQETIDANQDQRIEQFFHELDSVKASIGDTSAMPSDSAIIDSID
jgi:hypothetical protein